MTMEWNKREQRSNLNNLNPGHSFQAHNENMTSFYRAHPSSARVNSPHHTRIGLLESTRPFQLRYAVAETGGASRSIADWNTLIPVSRVAPHKLSPN